MSRAVRDAFLRQFNGGGPVKIREDLDRYERVIMACRPEVIVETGSHKGESANWFAHWAPVISVDIDHSELYSQLREHPSITWMLGDSVSKLMVRQVHHAVAGRRALVSLDSDHSTGHVYTEMRAYAPLVPVGGYMVVEDGIVKGPREALAEFLREHPEWMADTEIEALHPVTLFPSGWLRRLKPTEPRARRQCE